MPFRSHIKAPALKANLKNTGCESELLKHTVIISPVTGSHEFS